MLIQSELHEDIFVARPQGEISKAMAAELGDLLEAAIDDGARCVIFDCSGLNQMSSDGLRVLLKTLRRLQAVGGRAVVAAAGDRVRSVMAVSGLLGLLESYESSESAMASIQKITCATDRS
jgi:anti-sigma B factor antagonist